MKPFYFGPADSPLFGAYHAARATPLEGCRAVLICPPIGQEYIRSHWTLRLVAGQLARKGIHVMRMDYAGIGDSAGRISDIAHVSTWHQNIVAATDQLCDRSGADRVAVLGLRLGASLVWQVALDHPEKIHSIVSWEPVFNGPSHLEELRKLHARMLDFNNAKLTTPNDENCEELLGSVYSRSLIQQLDTYQPKLAKLIQPHLMLQLEQEGIALKEIESPWLLREIKVEDPYTWNRLTELETAWLVPKTVRKLVSSTVDLFDRLERFDLLQTDGLEKQQTNASLAIPSRGVNIGSTATTGV